MATRACRITPALPHTSPVQPIPLALSKSESESESEPIRIISAMAAAAAMTELGFAPPALAATPHYTPRLAPNLSHPPDYSLTRPISTSAYAVSLLTQDSPATTATRSTRLHSSAVGHFRMYVLPGPRTCSRSPSNACVSGGVGEVSATLTLTSGRGHVTSRLRAYNELRLGHRPPS